MSGGTISVVRVYITEGEKVLRTLLKWLHDEKAVRGVTVFRGIAGFGASGEMHMSGLLDMSLDLPLVVEFFDTPERVDDVMVGLCERIDPAHVIRWSARSGN